MDQEQIDKLVIENTQNIAKISQIVEETQKDLDKLIKHIDGFTTCKEHLERLENNMKRLDVVLFAVKYPKIVGIGLFGSYLFAIKDIRDPILMYLGFK